MYNLKSRKINHHVSEIKIDIDHDQKEIGRLINREDLIPYDSSNPISGSSDKKPGRWFYRNKVFEPKSKILSDFKLNIDDTIKDHLKAQRFNFSSFLIRDDPGFWCSKHVDVQTVKIVGFVSLNSEDRKDIATEFFHHNNDEPYYVSNTSYGSGVLFYNHDKLFHDGKNNSKTPRFLYGFYCT
jgi:hypothetical protein